MYKYNILLAFFFFIIGNGVIWGQETSVPFIPNEKDYNYTEGKLYPDIAEIKNKITEVISLFEREKISSAGEAGKVMKVLGVIYQNVSSFEKETPSSFEAFCNIFQGRKSICKDHPVLQWLQQKQLFLQDIQAHQPLHRVVLGRIFCKAFQYLEAVEEVDARLEKPFPYLEAVEEVDARLEKPFPYLEAVEEVDARLEKPFPLFSQQNGLFKEKIIQKINAMEEEQERAKLFALIDHFMYKDERSAPVIHCPVPLTVGEENIVDLGYLEFLTEKMYFYIYLSAIEYLSPADKKKLERVLGASPEELLKGKVENFFESYPGYNLGGEKPKNLSSRSNYMYYFKPFIIVAIGFTAALYLPSYIIKTKFYRKKLRARNRKHRRVVERAVLPLISGVIGATVSFLSFSLIEKISDSLKEKS